MPSQLTTSDPDVLRTALIEAQNELARYRDHFGCLDCGEIHHAECCPPHEIRTTGTAWFRQPHIGNRYNAMVNRIEALAMENQTLAQDKAQLEARVESLSRIGLNPVPESAIKSKQCSFGQEGLCKGSQCASWHWAVEFGCFCDLGTDEEPDGCVIDEGRLDDCFYAKRYVNKEQCPEWRAKRTPTKGYCARNFLGHKEHTHG